MFKVIFYSILSLIYFCLQTKYVFSCNPGLKGTVNCLKNWQQNHYSNHVLTQEKGLCLLLLHCTFQLLSYCKNHLHAKWIKSHFRPPFSNDKVTAQTSEETLETPAYIHIYEGEIVRLCTVTFLGKVDILISNTC